MRERDEIHQRLQARFFQDSSKILPRFCRDPTDYHYRAIDEEDKGNVSFLLIGAEETGECRLGVFASRDISKGEAGSRSTELET